jgi:hypothetical protein
VTEAGLLIPRNYEEARAVWPLIRTRLLAMAEKLGERWMPEDVLHLIAMRHATLWATDDLGCFIVTQMDEQPWGRSLVVWIASEATDATAFDYMEQVRIIADEANCYRVTFSSPRRWERALPGLTVRHEYSFDV